MDEMIRSRMHEALDAIEPPVGLRPLGSSPTARIPSDPASPLKFDWAYGVVAALLALTIVAGLLFVRGFHRNVPSEPIVHGIPSRPTSGMVSTTAGWMTGPAGHVFRTTDGGHTWNDVTPSTYVSTVVSPFFFDADHAWITQQASATSILVLRTANGGKSWDRGTPFTVSGLKTIGPTTLFFADSIDGWLLGSSIDPVLPSPQNVGFEFLYRTTDGGAHWRLITDNRAHPPACPWFGLAFSSLTTGWLTTYCGPSGGRPELLVSRDSGTTWATQPLPVTLTPGAYVFPPVLFGSSRGWLAIVGSDSIGLLLVTSDGGRTWTQRNMPGASQYGVGPAVEVLAGDFIDDRHAFLIAGPGLAANTSAPNIPMPLYRTDDGGVTWKAVKNNLSLVTVNGSITDVYFVSDRSGFAVSSESAPYTLGSRTLYATNDGGATWTFVGQIPT